MFWVLRTAAPSDSQGWIATEALFRPFLDGSTIPGKEGSRAQVARRPKLDVGVPGYCNQVGRSSNVGIDVVVA